MDRDKVMAILDEMEKQAEDCRKEPSGSWDSGYGVACWSFSARLREAIEAAS